MSAERILVVEDEPNVAETLVDRLKREGFDVVWSKSGAETRLEISKSKFHLVLMDVGLPDTNGFDLAGEVRSLAPETAIIFLTAFSNPEDRIKGLEIGAEDYVIKPFHFKELLLRIQNGLKRALSLSALGNSKNQVKIGKAEIDFPKFQVRVGGKTQALSHKECAVLRLLLERQGDVVSRDEILDSAWSENEFPTPRTVDNFILRLRKLVEIDPENPTIIRSVRGVGYQLSLKGSENE